MSKINDFISKDKNYYGKIYSDIAFAVDEIKDFIDRDTLRNRKYFSRQHVLEKYIELLDTAKEESKNIGFFKNLFDSDKYINLLQGYKEDHSEELDQLSKCSKCACLKCSSPCKFDSCSGCRGGRNVALCDHNRTNVASFDNSENSILELTNNKTGENDRYHIMAIVQDAKNDKRYILIENLRDKERFILYYYPNISEDDYGEIVNEDDFNFAASAYDNMERD